MLYFIIIFIFMLCVVSSATLASIFTQCFSITYAICMPLIVNAYVLVLLGLVTLLMRLFLPRSMFDHTKRIFKVERKEIIFYNKLKIKSWKEKIPEMGCTGGFPKDKLKSLEVNYLKKFLEENCFGEVMHVIVAILGFTALFFVPMRDYPFVFPILIINAILNILPALVQRYNRYRLAKIYELEKEKAFTNL